MAIKWLYFLENGYISERTVKEDNGIIEGGSNTTDKLFLLSLTEVRNVAYGFGSDATRAASDWWWLRSPPRQLS